MPSSFVKNLRNQKFFDKQNILSQANRRKDSESLPQKTLKIGVEIKNKIKDKNISKDVTSPKKSHNFKNSDILRKINQKICRNQQTNKRNLSSSQSIKSIKIVKFSIGDQVQQQRSLSNQSKGNSKRSILKNRLCSLQLNKNFQKNSLIQSSCSYLKSTDQTIENLNQNNKILEKYEQLRKQLQINKQKFTDSIYPPCQESIFLQNSYSKQFLDKIRLEGYKIKWVRLTQLYPNKQICLWSPIIKSVITKGFFYSSNKQNNYMPTVFNSINKSYCIQKFFENQKISQEGIYYVKMHQTKTNHWKYIIIDDFIPVIISNKNNEIDKIIKPAFLNIETQNHLLQLWPFLLQKAFAKYYLTYDSLVKGNTLDFLQEVTGDFYHTFVLNQKGQNQTLNRQNLQFQIKNPFNIILAETKDGIICPFKFAQDNFEILNAQKNFKAQIILKENIESCFTKLHIIQAKKYMCQLNCIIKQQHLIQRQNSCKVSKKPFILRSFILKQSSSCLLALTQKDKRFYQFQKSSKLKRHYSYSWMRMILVLKEFSGYRWIRAVYEKKKSIKMQLDLEEGEYFLIIMPQWITKPNDFQLSLFSNCQTSIQRQEYETYPRILEDSCMDLAQRFGKLTQINKNICSYNYIDYKIGFIIENINNQKSSGAVKILRTIDELVKYNITSTNAEFQQSTKLQIKIPSLSSYTVVLKVSDGGVDKTFLEQFDFGI